MRERQKTKLERLYEKRVNTRGGHPRNAEHNTDRTVGKKPVQYPPYRGPAFPANSCGQFHCSTTLPQSRAHVVIEQMYYWLKASETEELRVEVSSIQKHSPPPKPNIPKVEWRICKKLRADKARIKLVEGKVLAIVTMNKKDYIHST